jgi:hypothetical protein
MDNYVKKTIRYKMLRRLREPRCQQFKSLYSERIEINVFETTV